MINKRAKLPVSKIERKKVSKPELEKCRAKQKEIANSTYSGMYALHVYRVFNDLAFQHDVKTLRSKLEKLYYKDISLDTSHDDNHLLKDDKQLVKDIADKYCISFEDLGIYADGMFEDGYYRYGVLKSEYGGLAHRSEGNKHLLCYVIGPKTTL